MTLSLGFSSDGRSLVSGSANGTTKVWDMTDGSSRTLAMTGSVGAQVTGVAISSDGRLVAASSLGVCDLYSFVGVYSEFSSYR